MDDHDWRTALLALGAAILAPILAFLAFAVAIGALVLIVYAFQR